MVLAWPMIRELMEIRQRLDACLDETVYEADGQVQPAEGVFRPAADLYEDGDNVVIVMEVPGIAADTVELTVEGTRLRVAGASGDSEGGSEGRFLRMERSERGFAREFDLPDVELGDEPTGTLDHGVLVVRLPKAQTAKRRRIEVVEEES